MTETPNLPLLNITNKLNGPPDMDKQVPMLLGTGRWALSKNAGADLKLWH